MDIKDSKIRCDKCGEEMIVNTSMVLTSYPSQYGLICPSCGNYKTAYCHLCSENKKVQIYSEWCNLLSEVLSKEAL